MAPCDSVWLTLALSAHKVLDRLATPLLPCPSLSSPDKDLEKFPNKVTILSRCIVQLLLFVIFSMIFAFPAIRKYQEKEVGTNNLTFRFQRILTYFSKPSYGDVLCPYFIISFNSGNDCCIRCRDWWVYGAFFHYNTNAWLEVKYDF